MAEPRVTVMTLDQRDPFPRRTATPEVIVPWLVELTKTVPGLVASYVPGTTIDSRSRERIIMAVTEVNGCRYCAWIHGSWQDFLGEIDPHDADEAVLAYARACAEAGTPLPADGLLAVLPPGAIGAVRATVAQIEVSNLVGNTVDGVLARLTRKRPFAPLSLAREVLTVSASLPLAVPLLGIGSVLRLVNRAAPPMPQIDMPAAGEANLLVHLLAGAAPTYLANAAIRLAVLGMPFSVAIGLRAGRTGATLRFGRGELALENGIATDVVVVVEGEVEPLLQLATGSLVRELRSIRIRGN
jgi:alkylhydroperoxidase family enzyme